MQPCAVARYARLLHLACAAPVLKPFLGAFLECRGLPALCHRLPRQFRDKVGEGALGLRVGAVEGAGSLPVFSSTWVDTNAHAQLPFAALALWLVFLQLDYGACAFGFHGKIHLCLSLSGRLPSVPCDPPRFRARDPFFFLDKLSFLE